MLAPPTHPSPHRWRHCATAIAMLAGLSLAGCALAGRPGEPATARVTDSAPAAATAVSPPITGEELALVVNKSRQTLEVYRFGNLTGEFPVSVGSRPHGRKRYEGDMRTPEGLYRIIDKRTHNRWYYFLEIDYPNQRDVEWYEADLADGRIPVIDNKPPGVGGSLGIHGNDRPRDQAARRNWTRGCVAMRNADIQRLFELVDLGTPVLFVP